MKKVCAGYYTGTYKGVAFKIVKVAETKENLWYWQIGNKNVEDHHCSKGVALLAAKDYINQIKTIGA